MLCSARISPTRLIRMSGTISLLLDEKFHIIGITNYASIINRNAVIVELADLQELTFRTGVVTFISVRLERPGSSDEADQVAQAVESLADLTVTRSGNVLSNDSLIGLLNAVSTSMAWVALLMGVLMVLNTLLMAVLERTREIGILSAIGWSKFRVMGALVFEGFILSALGSLIGIVLGIAGSRLLSEIPAIGRYIAIEPTVGLIAATAVAAITLGILGSFYPAFLATRQSPAAALERA